MKKIIYLLTTLFILTGCNLDENPYTIDKDKFMNAPDGADLIVTSIYNVFWDSYMLKKTYQEWIDMDHDHASAEGWVVSGAGSGNVTTHWAYNGGSDLFKAFYLMVSRANYAIENLPSFTQNTSPEKLNQLIGEAYFLRAFAYFHLVRMYGPVPLRLQYITDRDMARSSVKDVYGRIVKDLEDADKLMTAWGTAAVDWGHANKTATKLLLAKVYATMGSGALSSSVTMPVDIKGTMTIFTPDAVAGYDQFDAEECYGKVKSLCDEVIARKGTEFDLGDNFQSIWGGKNLRNSEFVWGVPGHENYKTEHMNYYYGAIPFGGKAWTGMAMNLYTRYDATDNRALHGVFHYVKRAIGNANYERFPDDVAKYGTGPDGNPTTFSNYSDLVFITKYYHGDVTNPSPEAAPGFSYRPTDIIFIRFADAYLLRAEALNELNQTPLALADLDVIRNRADASLKEGTTTDKTVARGLIFEERALEFSQEFNRKFDLLRWGLYLKVMNTTSFVKAKYGSTLSKTRENKCVLYAVPRVEVQTNKLFGANNPGWN